jgi:hypothetical protein
VLVQNVLSHLLIGHCFEHRDRQAKHIHGARSVGWRRRRHMGSCRRSCHRRPSRGSFCVAHWVSNFVRNSKTYRLRISIRFVTQ